MRKNGKSEPLRKAAGQGQLWLHLPGLVREALYETVIGAGLACVDEVLEAERGRLCGARYQHQPERQALRAVTVLRSPWATAEFVASAEIAMSVEPNCDVGDSAVALMAASAVPHSPQKRLPGGFSASHFGQRFVNGAPQSPQNFLTGWVIAPAFRAAHQFTSCAESS